LLAENGIQTTGDLTTFPSLGDASAIANLIVVRREKETQNLGTRKLENVSVSPDGKELSFRLRTEIDVQKPELLMEQYGISQLFRITVAKATLNSSDGNLMGKVLLATTSAEVYFSTLLESIVSNTAVIHCEPKLFLQVLSKRISTTGLMGQLWKNQLRASLRSTRHRSYEDWHFHARAYMERCSNEERLL
jgi:hypothetical protein